MTKTSEVKLAKVSEVKISKERAEEIVQDLFDYYEVDEEEGQEDEFIKVGRIARRKFVTAIMKGRLEIEEYDKGIRLIQHFRSGQESLTYATMNAKAKIAMKRCDENDRAGQMHCLLGSLCGKGQGAVSRITYPDNSLTEVVAAFFMSI